MTEGPAVVGLKAKSHGLLGHVSGRGLVWRVKSSGARGGRGAKPKDLSRSDTESLLASKRGAW